MSKRVLNKALFICAGLIFLQACNDQAAAIKTTKAWTCLKDLPTPSLRQEVEILGGSMSREFKIYVSAEPKVTQQWLLSQKVFASAKKLSDSGGDTYQITPCEGAQFAEIFINKAQNEIVIHAYWG